MRLEINYAKRTNLSPFTFDKPLAPTTPLELSVFGGSKVSNEVALAGYLKMLNYMFRGVSNVVTSEIEYLLLQKNWFGTIVKEMDKLEWNAYVDPTYVVCYDISIHSIKEDLYAANGVLVKRDKQKGVDVQPIWSKALLKPTREKMFKNTLIGAIAIATEFIDDYSLKWGYKGRDGLSIVNKNNEVVKLADIDNDDSYILMQLIYLFLEKGKNAGIIMINGKGMKNKTVEGIVELVRFFFGDTYLFLYNCGDDLNIRREKIELPNFLNYQTSI